MPTNVPTTCAMHVFIYEEDFVTTIFMILDETEKTRWEDRNSKREYFANCDSMVAREPSLLRSIWTTTEDSDSGITQNWSDHWFWNHEEGCDYVHAPRAWSAIRCMPQVDSRVTQRNKLSERALREWALSFKSWSGNATLGVFKASGARSRLNAVLG